MFEAVGGGASPGQPGSPRPCSHRHHPAPNWDQYHGMLPAGPVLLLGAVIARPDTPPYAPSYIYFLFFPPVFILEATLTLHFHPLASPRVITRLLVAFSC